MGPTYKNLYKQRNSAAEEKLVGALLCQRPLLNPWNNVYLKLTWLITGKRVKQNITHANSLDSLLGSSQGSRTKQPFPHANKLASPCLNENLCTFQTLFLTSCNLQFLKFNIKYLNICCYISFSIDILDKNKIIKFYFFDISIVCSK